MHRPRKRASAQNPQCILSPRGLLLLHQKRQPEPAQEEILELGIVVERNRDVADVWHVPGGRRKTGGGERRC